MDKKLILRLFICSLNLGFKKDIWYAVDPITGLKTQTLTMEGTQNVCPSSGGQSIFIGRTGMRFKS